MNKERYAEIDLLKGIGIVLMIMGHVPFGKNVIQVIYIFHMPLFFIMSGFLYRKKDNWVLAIEKWFKRLILPYFIFSIMGYCLWFIEIKPTTVNQMIQPIKSIFWMNTDGMPINGAIWYLTATFVVFLLYCIIDHWIKNEIAKGIFILTLTLIGFFFGKMEIKLPFGSAVALVGIGFFYSGILLKKGYPYLLNNLKRSHLFCWGAIALCFVMFFLGYQNGHVSMRTETYGDNGFVFFVAAIVVTDVLLFMARFFTDRFSDLFLLKWLEMVGRNSIVFLGLNELVINVIASILSKIGITSHIYIIITFILSCLVLSIIVKILMKVKWTAQLFSLS